MSAAQRHPIPWEVAPDFDEEGGVHPVTDALGRVIVLATSSAVAEIIVSAVNKDAAVVGSNVQAQTTPA